MRPLSRSGATWILLFLAASPSRKAPAESADPLFGTPPLDFMTRSALVRAMDRAGRKLDRPGCREVFAGFRDPAGRTLQENLDATGRDAAGFLRGLSFASGQGRPACEIPSVLAVTSPGSRKIYLCAQFQETERRDRGLASALLIHEALHSLGLGENPPHSMQITAYVISRCGR